MKKLTLVGLLILLSIGGQIFAQDAEKTVTLTVDEAVEYAMKNSKTLQSAAIDLQMKERAKNNSWNVFLPNVSAMAVGSRKNEVTTMSIPGIPLPPAPEPEEVDHWTVLGKVDVSLNLSLAYIGTIQTSFANYEAGLITWEQTLKETELNIRKMFYALLLQQSSLELQFDSLANAEKRVEQAEINYKNGYIPELSLLQTQVSYENQKPQVLKAEQNLKQQLKMFAFLIGLPLDTNISLDGKIEPVFIDIDEQKDISPYIQDRLDIQSFNASKNMLQKQLFTLNLQSFSPALSVSYGWNPVVKDIKEGWFDKDNISDNGSLSFSLVWNLTNMLPFSSNRQQAKDVAQNIEKMELQYQTVLENAEIEIYNLIDTLKYSESAIEATKRSIELAQKSYDMTVVAYEQGAKELLDVKDAESQLNQAKLGEISEKYNYLANLLDLEFALNTNIINN